jgi:hypothetical protein
MASGIWDYAALNVVGFSKYEVQFLHLMGCVFHQTCHQLPSLSQKL